MLYEISKDLDTPSSELTAKRHLLFSGIRGEIYITRKFKFVVNFLCILMFDVVLNTTTAVQKYTFSAILIAFINMPEWKISAVLSYNH
jgi:hypothetical protein